MLHAISSSFLSKPAPVYSRQIVKEDLDSFLFSCEGRKEILGIVLWSWEWEACAACVLSAAGLE